MAAPTGTLQDGVVIKEIHSHRDLADYLPKLTEEQFETLAHYLELGEGERGGNFQALNFVSPSLPGILAEMRTLQFQSSPRRKGRDVYHFVISRRGKSDPQLLMAMGKRLLHLLGLDRQHALLSIHDDTDHTHLHIAVHAREADGKLVEVNKGFTRFALQHANAVLCYEHGLTPEAGVEFYANADGVFRKDHHQIRNADFVLITNDAGSATGGKTAKSKREEDRTGYQSHQSFLQEHVPVMLERAASLPDFLNRLASANIRYECVGSGGRIGIEGEWFKASQIAPRLSAKKIAARFGVRHYTTKQRKEAGFYQDWEDDGPPIRQLSQVAGPSALIYRKPLTGDMATDTRSASLRDIVEEAWFPAFDPSHAEPLQRELRYAKGRFSENKDVFPHRIREARWITDRLRDVIKRMGGQLRGRPPKPYSQPSDNMPKVEPNETRGCLQGTLTYAVLPNRPWPVDVRVEGDPTFQTVYRNDKIIVNLSPRLITVHHASDADLAHALKIATDKWRKVSVYGDSKFQRRMIRIAVREGVVLGNVELASYQARARDRYAEELSRKLRANVAALAKITDRLATAAGAQLATLRRHRAVLSIADRLKPAVTSMLSAAKDRTTSNAAALKTLASNPFAAAQTKLDVWTTRLEMQGQAIQARTSERDAQQAARAREAERERQEAMKQKAVADAQQQAAVAANIDSIYALVRSGKLVITDTGKRPVVTSAGSTQVHSLATSMLAAPGYRQRMIDNAREYQLEVEAKKAQAEAAAKAAKAAAGTALKAELAPIGLAARIIKAGERHRSPGLISKIDHARIAIDNIGRSFDARSAAKQHKSAAVDRMYKRWDAYELLDNGLAVGAIDGSILTLTVFADLSKQQHEIDAADLPEAQQKVDAATVRLNDLQEYARAGQLSQDEQGRLAVHSAVPAELTELALRLWQTEIGRAVLSKEMDAGKIKRAEDAASAAAVERVAPDQPPVSRVGHPRAENPVSTLTSPVVSLRIPERLDAQLQLLARAEQPPNWDKRDYRTIDLAEELTVGAPMAAEATSTASTADAQRATAATRNQQAAIAAHLAAQQGR